MTGTRPKTGVMMMMMTTNDFLHEWDALSEDAVGVNRRLFPNLALEIRVGRDPSGRPMMAVQTAQKMDGPPQLAGIDISFTRTLLGVHWLVISLVDLTAIDEFAVLCKDLVDQVQGITGEKEALLELLRCLDRWKNLFRTRRGRILSKKALRSLMSEVVALLHLAAARDSLQGAVRAWVGPKGAPQDFHFELEARAYEVKAVHRDQTSFTVSSIAQLDSADYGIHILLVQLEDLGPNESGGIRLIDVLKNVLKELQIYPHEFGLFQQNLEEIGFSLAEREYQDLSYAVDRVKTYSVESDFPRLVRADLPAAVVSAKYQLDSEALAAFLVSDDEISINALMGGA